MCTIATRGAIHMAKTFDIAELEVFVDTLAANGNIVALLFNKNNR